MGLNLKNMAGGLNLGGLFGGDGGAGAGYLKTLTKADLIVTGTAVVAGKWTLLGEYVVPAQQEITIGYGYEGAQKNQGTVVCNPESVAGGANLIPGVLRLQVADANDVVKPGGVAMEERTEILGSQLTDRTKQVPLPEYPIVAKEDDKIQLWMKSDGADTIITTTTASQTTVPTTVRRVSR